MEKSISIRLDVFGTILLVSLLLSSEGLKAQRRTGGGSDVVTGEAVWKPPQRVWGRIQDGCRSLEGHKLVECVTSMMQRSGAPPRAVEFTRMLGETVYEGSPDGRFTETGWMESFREMGTVDLASVFYPFRANTNLVFILVNGVPPVVETSLTGEYQDNTDYLDERKRVNIKTDPLYRFLVRRFPNLDLELSRNEFEGMRPAPTGGQEFVFSYALVNGCRACKVVGHALVGFDFNGAGKFLGTRLLRLSQTKR